ncbi:hypothetical protein HF086_001570 [Spodoptera exigua]|uniref:Peptidase S1 domain-containing protein n=1 Tax=Spodoptera exigua TaxID=7107 RepID=A0A922MQ83_SPOEX|nr:hypothetical protein HF086_001570 [Spodoptera exigua]
MMRGKSLLLCGHVLMNKDKKSDRSVTATLEGQWPWQIALYQQQAREELTLLEMPVVDQQTCLNSYEQFFGIFTSDKTFCAGYRDVGSACNGDSGGGMVFEKDGAWYLRGVVSLSVARKGVYRCDPNHYVIFTDVAKFLPWIEEHVEEYL